MIKKKTGFSIFEIILAIGILILLFLIQSPLYHSFKVSNDLTVTVYNAVQGFSRASTKAQASHEDSQWGIKFETGGRIIVFKGPSFTGRDISRDEALFIPNTVVISGMTEVIFDKISGLPNATGTITFTTQSGESKTLTINEKGVVQL